MQRTNRPSLRRVLASAIATALVASAAALGTAVPAQAADGYTLSAVAAVTPSSTVTVTATGSGYADIPLLPGQSQRSFYLALIPVGTDLGSVSLGGGAPAVAVYPDSAGNVSGSLEQAAATLDRTASYEVIAWPSRSNPSASNLYARAAVTIDWAALFPAAATTTSLAASPEATAVAGSAVALTATVSPAAAGSVTFFDGTASLGTEPVANGTATLRTSSLAAGAHALTAVFAPADTAAFAGSTSGAVAYTITAPAPQRVPTLTLSTSTDLNPDGETITVTGTGYNPNQPIYLTTCADVPLSSVSFGFISNGCTVGAKQVTSNPTSPTMVRFAEDGSFTTTFTVAPKGDTTAVYTIANHTAMNDRSQDAKAVVTFATRTPEPEPEPEPETGEPTVTVTPAAGLDPAAQNVLEVEGAGFTGPGAANGVYVLFGETSVWNGGSALPTSGWIAQSWVPAGQILDGGFSTTVTVPAGQLDASKSYQIATSAAHGLSITDRSLDTFTPVSVAQPVAPYVAFPLSASVQQGQMLTISGGGFAEGAVVTAIARSEPVTIGTATAGANGLVSFSWSVPASFEAGVHTLELSVDGQVVASAPFTVTAAAAAPAVEQPAAPACVARSVSGASIQWGVKESFRSYVTGPVASGSVSGGWGSGSGAYSTETDRGRVSFGGSVHYTGHNGALDMTLSNPRIQINGSGSASLILNVQSKGFNGSPDTSANGIVFATLSLPAANESASRISFSGASATLTAAGAEAFAGFYSAGAALDAVSFSLPLGAEVPCDSSTGGNLAATGGTAPVDALWLGLGVLTLGALLTVVVRRRQRV